MNYTCAPDTLYSLIEAMIVSPEGGVWRDHPDPILKAAEDLVNWRVKNNFSWTHEAREEFWEKLCEAFPAEMMPKGTVNAAVDTAVDYLSRTVPIKVVVQGSCLNCHIDLGWYKYQFENAVEINTTNLKVVPSSLSDLFLAIISRQMNKLLGPGGRRVQCTSCGSWGAKVRLIILRCRQFFFLVF